MNYLKEDTYYQDLYDLFTINDCLSWENSLNSRKLPKLKGEKINKQALIDLALYYIKGERYKNRADSIRKWQEKDRDRQEKFDSASEPQGIYCPSCSVAMEVTFKTSEDYQDKPFRVLFFFGCTKCKKRLAIYDDGEELISKPQLCPNCSSEIKTTYKESRKVLTTIEKCTNCNYSKTEVDDFEKNRAKWREKEEADKEKLAQYREKYCLSDSEGSSYIRETEGMRKIMEMFHENQSKKADLNYQKAVQAKKITVVELEKLLNKVLVPERYIKLTLEKPEMGKFVVIPFTVQDSDPERKEYDSTHDLKKVLKTALEDTNWRLMTDGTYFRMGYVSGRLKGYEREEDLAELFGWKKDSLENKSTKGTPFSFEVDLDDPKKRGYEY